MRVLLNGGSHSDIPALLHLKKAGHEVITTGNKPSERGHSLSDRYICADFSDRDAIRQIIKDTKPDVLLPSCNDYSYLTACALAEEFGFKGYDPFETARSLHHKDSFRRICEKLGIPAPRHKAFELTASKEFVHDLRYPVLAKSTDLTGGKGIFRCENDDDLRRAAEAIRAASKRSSMVVEEVFEGTLHSFSTFIRRQEVIFSYSDKEYLYPNSYLVQSSLGPYPISAGFLRDLIGAVEAFAREFKLVDGIVHVQFLMNERDVTIVEITRRCPGDMYAVPVDLLFGKAFYTQALLAGYLGESIAETPRDMSDLRSDAFVSRACIMVNPGISRVDHIQLDEVLLPHLVRIEPYVEFPVPVVNAKTEKFGLAFLRFDTFSLGDGLLERFMDIQQVL